MAKQMKIDPYCPLKCYKCAKVAYRPTQQGCSKFYEYRCAMKEK